MDTRKEGNRKDGIFLSMETTYKKQKRAEPYDTYDDMLHIERNAGGYIQTNERAEL